MRLPAFLKLSLNPERREYSIKNYHNSYTDPCFVEYIKKINGRPLREGDFVRQGELLARVDTVLRAPFDGIVAYLNIREGL
ncbi:hypothetical protein [Moorena sp. SIO3H5]|uniref:hypothetical protein n=1 Tax=Moorena sp. SIO3H5 TaxID=2607834 RepID=UPI0013BC9A00|nr:hypothetical protein [Moorena sp. SIO3H5]NEO70331.1 hypothetical protein [Moorena sp. SIO3H5]